jgi:hypothetical protein
MAPLLFHGSGAALLVAYRPQVAHEKAPPKRGEVMVAPKWRRRGRVHQKEMHPGERTASAGL